MFPGREPARRREGVSPVALVGSISTVHLTIGERASAQGGRISGYASAVLLLVSALAKPG